jgi:hypothetical protein
MPSLPKNWRDNHVIRCVSIIIALLLTTVVVGPLWAQLPAGSAPEAASRKGRFSAGKEAPAVTPEQEAAVFEFVEQHHPELGNLLRHLKENQPKRAYQRAIRDLSIAHDRLAALEENDRTRYELELQAWKVKSRIQLLSAKLTMSQDEQLKSDLKESLAEQYDTRLALLELEQSRLRDRLLRSEKQLADLTARREATLEKQWQAIVSGNAPGKGPRGKSSAGGNPPEKRAAAKRSRENEKSEVRSPSSEKREKPRAATTAEAAR